MSDIFQVAAIKIKEAIKIAHNTPNNPEGKLRELVAPIWDECLRACNIRLNFTPRDERMLANGKPDTVFNRLILEYKKPFVIHSDNNKNRKLISQVQGYIVDLANEERWKEDRLLGVAFDGDHFLYLQRKKSNSWLIGEPIPVNAESIKQFILYLEKLTSKAALIPGNLITDFALGGKSTNFIASNTIKAFYFTILNNKNERVKVFFDQWAIQFSEVHGSFENKKFDAETLFKSYGFKKQEQKDFNFLAFFFALDTYYAVLMKLLAYQVVGFYVLKHVVGLPLSDWENLDSDSLKNKVAQLEEGGIFRNLGIRNFLEGDLLSWYLNDWNNSIYQSISKIIERLNQYDPETMELIPDETRDILKKLYQFLVPRVIRHDLGEYYTPDWLAERCLDLVGYGPKVDKLLEKRILDPGCGSGTFVILGIKRAKEHARSKNIDPSTTLSQITKNIIGFDLNPLAVISARTNYLLAVADLLPYRKDEITIPIYLCDSICPPSAIESPDLFGGSGGSFIIKTSVGVFSFPEFLIKKEMIQKVTLMLEESVKNHLSKEKFIEKVIKDFQITEKIDIQNLSDVLGETYLKLVELEQKGINGIWARIIKNAFAPLFVGQFNFIVGNPPWVNWEDLPNAYRDQTKSLWIKYGLFSLSGHEARLGGGKKDISMLMTYVAIDKYLKDHHKLCFIITQTLFKTQGAGDGFRRYQLGTNDIHFKLEYIDDMVDLQPFEGATNFTSLFLVIKNSITNYPIPYTLWQKKIGESIGIDLSLPDVIAKTIRKKFHAQPVNKSDKCAPLMTARLRSLQISSKVLGNSYYSGFAGCTTWLNGVFFGTYEKGSKKVVLFKNDFDDGKIKVKNVIAEIEDTLLFPLLRGRDFNRWDYSISTSVILTQNPKTKFGFDETWMLKNVPKTLDYLCTFKDVLQNRSGYKKYLKGKPFYSIYNVSENTMSPFKVVWKALASKSQAVVVSSSIINHTKKVVIPEHNTIFIPCYTLIEAHYLCAVLNSAISSFVFLSYVALFFSTHILENLNIHKYDSNNTIHNELSKLSNLAHERTSAGIQISDLEEQIDELNAELWGLTKQELKDIKDSLEEIS